MIWCGSHYKLVCRFLSWSLFYEYLIYLNAVISKAISRLRKIVPLRKNTVNICIFFRLPQAWILILQESAGHFLSHTQIYFAYHADGSLNVSVGLNHGNSFLSGRLVEQIEGVVAFMISQLDFELTREGVSDRRTQERLGEILGNIRILIPHL